MAGRRARPQVGTAESGLRAFNALLEAAAVVTIASESAAATTTVATKTVGIATTTVTANAAASGLGVSLVVKSVVIGFTIGVGMLGAGTAAEKAYQNFHGSSVAITTKPKTPPQSVVLTHPSEPVARAQTQTDSLAVSTPIVDSPGKRPPAATQYNVPTVSVGIEPQTTSLAEQAYELAQIKQLIDAGASAKALAQLEVSFNKDVHTPLAEERDALYVQALKKSRENARAKLFAIKFIARYPNSPHVEKMRALIAVE
jgi:hypothetical protein